MLVIFFVDARAGATGFRRRRHVLHANPTRFNRQRWRSDPGWIQWRIPTSFHASRHGEQDQKLLQTGQYVDFFFAKMRLFVKENSSISFWHVAFRNLEKILELLTVSMERLCTATRHLFWVLYILDSCFRSETLWSTILSSDEIHLKSVVYPFHRHLKTTFSELQFTCTRCRRQISWFYEHDTATLLESLQTFL